MSTQSDSFLGVRIDSAPQPFQIVQQNDKGFGRFSLSGRWNHPEKQGQVQLRVMREEDSTVAVPWTSTEAKADGTWAQTIDNVPVGGLYRIETRYWQNTTVPAEWSIHGDFVHHVGVGDVWIIAGQSNAAGYGRGPVVDPPRLGVHILKNDETWDIATHIMNETTRSQHPNIEAANPGHAPYLAFGKALHDVLGYPIGLIQTSLGGSPLSQWNPVENPEGALWKNLMHCLQLAGNASRGMVWYQGESDANLDVGPTYEKRFADFVRSLRQHLGNDKLAVIIAQLNRCPGAAGDANGNRGWAIVREAQRRVGLIGNAAVVPTTDLSLSDGIHTSADGNVTLGKRKAMAALDIAYNRPSGVWRAPDVVAATFKPDRKTIELTFQNVPTRLNNIGPVEPDFVVEDETGPVKITRATIPSRDVVRIELDTEPTGTTKVHGNYGTHPSAHIRDAEENLPMLGFYRLVVR